MYSVSAQGVVERIINVRNDDDDNDDYDDDNDLNHYWCLQREHAPELTNRSDIPEHMLSCVRYCPAGQAGWQCPLCSVSPL